MRVGTLRAVGLAVYARADGSLYWLEDGCRVPVHGNTKWVSLDGKTMRGPLKRPAKASKKLSKKTKSKRDDSSDSDSSDEVPRRKRPAAKKKPAKKVKRDVESSSSDSE